MAVNVFPFLAGDVFLNRIGLLSVRIGDKPAPTVRAVKSPVGHDQHLFDLGKSALADGTFHRSLLS